MKEGGNSKHRGRLYEAKQRDTYKKENGILEPESSIL